MEHMKWLYLILVGFSLSLLWSLTSGKVGNDGDTLATRQKNHRPKTFRKDRMRKVAEWSDSRQDMEYFRKILLKPILRERQPDTEGSREVQEHIRTFMRSYGWTITEDSFYDDTPHGGKNFNSIIATQNPAASRKLVLACHHDSKVFKEFTFIAATDSAVPCAMMLDIARHWNSTLWNPQKNTLTDVSLQFWFLDGEEAFNKWSDSDSLYGARNLAFNMENNIVQTSREEFVPEIRTIDVMVLLDLIGTSTTSFRSFFLQTEKLFQRCRKIEENLSKEGLLNYPPTNREYFKETSHRHAGIQDDHIPFLDRGVRVLHLISYPFPKEWHKESDNEAALDFDTINNIGKILRVFVGEYLHLKP